MQVADPFWDSFYTVWGMCPSSCFFLCPAVQLFLLPSHGIGTLHWISVDYTWGFISRFSILFHWAQCLPLCQYHIILINIALCMFWSWEVWVFWVGSFSIIFIIKIPRFLCWNLGKLILKLLWKCKKPRINKILEQQQGRRTCSTRHRYLLQSSSH